MRPCLSFYLHFFSCGEWSVAPFESELCNWKLSPLPLFFFLLTYLPLPPPVRAPSDLSCTNICLSVWWADWFQQPSSKLMSWLWKETSELEQIWGWVTRGAPRSFQWVVLWAVIKHHNWPVQWISSWSLQHVPCLFIKEYSLWFGLCLLSLISCLSRIIAAVEVCCCVERFSISVHVCLHWACARE